MVSKTSLLPLVRSFDWKAVDAGLQERPSLSRIAMSAAGTGCTSVVPLHSRAAMPSRAFGPPMSCSLAESI
jgi:hypothetical protein